MIATSQCFTAEGKRVHYIRSSWVPSESHIMCLFEAPNAKTELPNQADMVMWIRCIAMGDLAFLGVLETAEQLSIELREWMERTYAAPQIQAFSPLGQLRLAQHRDQEATVALARAMQVWDGRWTDLQPLLLHAVAAHGRSGNDANQPRTCRGDFTVRLKCGGNQQWRSRTTKSE